MSQDLPPAGWYPDPTGSGQRYWDGTAWTSAATAEPAAVPNPPASRPDTGGSGTWVSAGHGSHGPHGGVPAGASAADPSLLDQAKRLPPLVWIGVVVLLMVGVVLLTRGSATNDIAGSFTLIDSRFGLDGDGEPCSGSGGYSDIGPGRTVTVRDASGTVIATSSLGQGRREVVSCVFEFELTDVPRSDYYSFEVGRRGELSYPHDELEARDWTVDFSLGG